MNMNLSSLHQDNLTKTIAQINYCLFIYMKLKAMDHVSQHVSLFGRRKEWLVCAYDVLDLYGQFQAATVKY